MCIITHELSVVHSERLTSVALSFSEWQSSALVTVRIIVTRLWGGLRLAEYRFCPEDVTVVLVVCSGYPIVRLGLALEHPW